MNKKKIVQEIFKELYNYRIDESNYVCMNIVSQLGELEELKEFAKKQGEKDNCYHYARAYLLYKLYKKWCSKIKQ